MATITNVLATDSLASGKNKINTNFSNLNTDKLEFSQNGDFYKYQISRTVDGSGNLTTTLLNYLGATPSASAPVKVQIGDMVRTITSACTITRNAGQNYLNLGSAELATKEVDLFTYCRWDTGANAVCLDISRYPNATVTGDFVQSGLSEKGYLISSFAGSASTDKEQLIGRFNAILSGGAAYTWSIPATSVIMNRPIYETRWLDSSSTLSAEGSMTVTNVVINHFKYKIVGDNLFYKNNIKMDFGGTINNSFFETLPFGRSITESYDIAGVGFGYDNSDIAPSVIFESANTNKLRIIKLSSVYAIVANANIRIMGNYKI